MTLEFTDPEIHAVTHLVEERLRILRTEIAHTSTHDFKNSLKEHELLLEKLLDRLKIKEVA